MTYRRGYTAEYRCKKELQEIYGRENIIKIAIAQQGADFLVINNKTIIKLIEVKEVHNREYYPSPREKEQMLRIIKFAKEHCISAELWIYRFFGRGKTIIKKTETLY